MVVVVNRGIEQNVGVGRNNIFDDFCPFYATFLLFTVDCLDYSTVHIWCGHTIRLNMNRFFGPIFGTKANSTDHDIYVIASVTKLIVQ